MSQNRSQQQPLATQGAQPKEQGLARVVSGTLTRLPNKGSISTADPNQASQWIDDAYQQTGLVAAPFGNSVPLMPPGYAVSVTPVQVTDFNDGFDGTQIYPIKGSRTKKGLLKTVMDDLATGMGFDWPPQWTWVEKFGDERDQDRLCQKITVCGRYKDVDGSWKTAAPQTKEIDLREGSDEVNEIRARQLTKALSDLPPNATPDARAERERLGKRNADAELAGPRKFIRSYAQTKARLMVIGTKVRRSYTIEELKKGPIYCFRVVQTWRSDNPETQARFDQAIINREMGSSAMLFGAAPAARELPPVSDQPYPEDAGVVGEAKLEQGQEQSSEPQYCTPEVCHMDNSDGHIRACRELKNVPIAPVENLALPEEWVVPADVFPQHGGKKIGDVSDAALSSMFDGCVLIREQKELATKHAQYAEYQKHFNIEIDRRRKAKESASQLDERGSS